RPLAGVMGKIAHPGALVQRQDRIGTERAEAHRGDIEDRCRIGLTALGPTDLYPELLRVPRYHRQQCMTDELVPGEVDVLLGAEGSVRGLVLGPGIHQ